MNRLARLRSPRSCRSSVRRRRDITGRLAPGWRWMCGGCHAWNCLGVCATRNEAMAELEAHVTRKAAA